MRIYLLTYEESFGLSNAKFRRYSGRSHQVTETLLLSDVFGDYIFPQSALTTRVPHVSACERFRTTRVIGRFTKKVAVAEAPTPERQKGNDVAL